MDYMEKNNRLYIPCPEDFDPRATFDCGQCFRWSPEEDGYWVGVAYGLAARVSREGDCIVLSGVSPEDYEAVWRDYFDLSRDYAAARETLSADEVLREAIAFGQGLRILRQEPFETLISFILSSCNHIPRIRQIIETLCRLYGDPIPFEGRALHAFPSPERLAALSLPELAPLKAGYRDKYVLDAARRVASGELDLGLLSTLPVPEARELLKTVDGVGNKVADCVLLFGAGRMECFPADVWIKRALRRYYGIDADDGRFGPLSGIAQQYIFYYARHYKI